MDDYDEKTCITAGELRAGGLPIADSIPDCGWIPKASIKFLQPEVTIDKLVEGKVNIAVAAEFTVPFKWVKINLTLDTEEDNSAREEVERHMRRAGIIEDPDIDGGILG